MNFFQLIRHHIYKNSFLDALDVLKSQNNYELYYQFTPILMQEVPKLTVKALIDQGKRLNPTRILPALVTCETEFHAKEVIKYLEHCVTQLKNNEKAIHNFLISLYAKYDHKKLMTYLTTQRQDLNLVCFSLAVHLKAEWETPWKYTLDNRCKPCLLIHGHYKCL